MVQLRRTHNHLLKTVKGKSTDSALNGKQSKTSASPGTDHDMAAEPLTARGRNTTLSKDSDAQPAWMAVDVDAEPQTSSDESSGIDDMASKIDTSRGGSYSIAREIAASGTSIHKFKAKESEPSKPDKKRKRETPLAPQLNGKNAKVPKQVIAASSDTLDGDDEERLSSWAASQKVRRLAQTYSSQSGPRSKKDTKDSPRRTKQTQDSLEGVIEMPKFKFRSPPPDPAEITMPTFKSRNPSPGPAAMEMPTFKAPTSPASSVRPVRDPSSPSSGSSSSAPASPAASPPPGSATTARCPFCNLQVDSALLAEYTNGRTLGYMRALDFCASHRAGELQKSTSYPAVDWAGFGARLAQFHDAIHAILLQQDASALRQELVQRVGTTAGRNALRNPDAAAATKVSRNTGYYGARGAKRATAYIMDHFADEIRSVAATDDLFAEVGVPGVVQNVLVPELILLLVREDYGCDEGEARAIIEQSGEVGDLLAADAG